MTASYEKLNYRLRPAKHIERGMIVEALQRLRMFAPLRQYRYIGLGSLYFADFVLVHKTLGIKTMVCIEKDEPKRDRFEFNRPFRTVEIKFGHSNAVLPTLKWAQRSIVWLDYDCGLNKDVLTDIGWVCGAARSGTVLIVSVNAEPEKEDDDEHESKRVVALRTAVGSTNVPEGITKAGHLAGWRLAEAGRTIIDSAIRESVYDRSVPGDRFGYRQLFNFEYRDGVRMSTVGGIILSDDDCGRFDECEFHDLPYMKDGAEALRIEVPFLTNREVRLLDRYLPATSAGLSVSMIPERARKAYAASYRFFPTFVDAEF
jgi:hypothetical protein